MTWIFDTCTDEFGSCIRQYIMLGVSFIVLLLALYSLISILRQENRLSFQLLPIAVNSGSSLVVFAIYTQMEVFNIRIAMLIVEVYAYFLLTYGFVGMVFKESPRLRRKMNVLKRIFIIVSLITMGAIISMVVLTFIDAYQCKDDQGAGSIALIILEVPLFLITYIFSIKSQKIINSGSKAGKTEYTHKTQHLLNDEDQYKRIKILQLKLVQFAFVVTFVLHAIQVFCYFYGNEEIICSEDTNRITVTSGLELYILTVQNISEMFPHFIIPFIFWYLPARLTNRSASVFMTSQHSDDEWQSRDHSNSGKLKMNRTESKLVNDVRSQEEIRQRLNQLSPTSREKHLNRLPTL